MKRISFGLVGLMVLSLASFAHGEEYDAEQTLKSFGDFVVGGTWTMKDNGKETTHQYSWFGGNKFLRVAGTEDGKPADFVLVFGVDPKTKKVTIWGFSDKGVVVATVTQQQEGVWDMESESTGGAGHKILWKGKFARVGKDELHLDTVEVTVDGAKTDEGFLAQRWKRHKS